MRPSRALIGCSLAFSSKLVCALARDFARDVATNLEAGSHRALAICCLLGFAASLLGSGIAAAEYSAQTNYILHCQGCNGADGIGGTPGEVPPLAHSVGYFLRVEEGREYLAQVPGAANAPVSDTALASLLTYMVNAFSSEEAGADFAPYTAREVTAVRRSQPDIVALRARLVSRLREKLGIELWAEGDEALGENYEVQEGVEGGLYHAAEATENSEITP